MKRLLILAFVGMLTACTTTTNAPQATPSRGGSLQGQVDSFLVNTALATVYAEKCASFGVKLKNTNSNASINGFVLGLVGQGYTEQQINAAVSKARRKDLGKVAVQRLINRGVQPGSVPSLCNAARKEIAENTGVGALMRRG